MTPPKEISREERLWLDYNQQLQRAGIPKNNAPVFRFRDNILPDGLAVRNFDDGEGLIRGNKNLTVPSPAMAYLEGPIHLPSDLMLVYNCADALRQLGHTEVTLVADFLTSTRGDQPAKPSKPFKESIAIRLVGDLLAGSFSRVVIVQPHSGITASYLSRELSLPAVGISPWRPLVESLMVDLDFKTDNLLVVGPDKGRTSTASKIAEFLGVKLVSLDKKRDGTNGDITIGDLTTEQIESLRDKEVIIYDDVIATGGTMLEIIKKLEQAGVAGVHVLACHAVFSGKAVENLSYPLIKGVRITDSRKPKGDLTILGEKLIVLPIQPFIENFISADRFDPDFNPWRNKAFINSITENADEIPQELRLASLSRRRRARGNLLYPVKR